MNVEKSLKNANDAICGNIASDDKKIKLSNIMAHTRNLIEAVLQYDLELNHNKTIDRADEAVRYSKKHFKTVKDYNEVFKFHDFNQKSNSHYSLDYEESSFLMVKYLEYFYHLKKFARNKLGCDILCNLDDLKINEDAITSEFYNNVANYIVTLPEEQEEFTSDRYYITKVMPFFHEDEIFYEVTYENVKDLPRKTTTFIAYSKIKIPTNYSVMLNICEKKIEFLDFEVSVKVIRNWKCSIRPCEIERIVEICDVSNPLSKSIRIQSNNTGLQSLNNVLTSTGYSLYELVSLEKEEYKHVIEFLTKNSKDTSIINAINVAREIILSNNSGVNILSYILFNIRNTIIKNQMFKSSNNNLSNLHLSNGCIPFDLMPFATKPKGHNPRFSDLISCISSCNREHEFLARYIHNNMDNNGVLHTKVDELSQFGNKEKIKSLIDRFNSLVHPNHIRLRKMVLEHDHVFVQNEENLIVDTLKSLDSDSKCEQNFQHQDLSSWLSKHADKIDCDVKKNIISTCFVNSKLLMIYGSAGTGKTTTLDYIADLYEEEMKIVLSKTNASVDNLKNKIKCENAKFMTIDKYISDGVDEDVGILIVDECSTVSNSQIHQIIKNDDYSLLILVGDIYQIESIRFGNWFQCAKEILDDRVIYELNETKRATNSSLVGFWKKVRENADSILEHAVRCEFSCTPSKDVFSSIGEDEIILSLSYDGLFGINNINSIMQQVNDNKGVIYKSQMYKIGDPIIFNGIGQTREMLHNNLKGRIHNIDENEKEIIFELVVNKVVNKFDCLMMGIKHLKELTNDRSVIELKVKKSSSTDEDSDIESNKIIPFTVAYAVSIHKSQGLEYESVRVIIPAINERMIKHNVFYTAVTRAKNNLKIYWTPEVANTILENFNVSVVKPFTKQRLIEKCDNSKK